MHKLSVVIPCYNSEKNIEQVVANLEEYLRKCKIDNFEFVLVNDCSRDHTSTIIKKLAEEKTYVIAIDLAKNTGQHGALMAGFHYVSGEYVVTCEDDGQTQVGAVVEMLNKIQEGYDVVFAKYVNRPIVPPFRRFGTYIAAKTSRLLMSEPKDIDISIFFMARRFVINEIIKYDNPYPYVTGLLLRTTHNIANIEVNQLERMTGKSGYTFRKLLNLWLNGFTAFSVKPLRLAVFFGMFSSIAGVFFAIIIIIRKIVLHDIVAGWSSLISIILIMSGIILCVLGLIGEYIGRIYICINNAPQYVIKSVTKKESNVYEED